MTHEPHWDDVAERLALQSLGAATPLESDRLQEHLAEGCAECEAELARLDEVVAELTAAAPALPPPPSVKQALMGRITGASGRSASPLEQHLAPNSQAERDGGLVTVRARDAKWEQTAVPGVLLCVLAIDRQRDQFTALVRMAPGAAYPRHVHRGPEHCLVLEGDLQVGDETLRAGDYQLARVDSGHGIQTTEGGCLLYIQSSLSDEFV